MTNKHEPEEGFKVCADRNVHVPVLLPSVMGLLSPLKNKTVIDATFGRGGYSAAMLAAGAGRVLAIDRDPQALEAGKRLQEKHPDRLLFVKVCLVGWMNMRGKKRAARLMRW